MAQRKHMFFSCPLASPMKRKPSGRRSILHPRRSPRRAPHRTLRSSWSRSLGRKTTPPRPRHCRWRAKQDRNEQGHRNPPCAPRTGNRADQAGGSVGSRQRPPDVAEIAPGVLGHICTGQNKYAVARRFQGSLTELPAIPDQHRANARMAPDLETDEQCPVQGTISSTTGTTRGPPRRRRERGSVLAHRSSPTL
jgi:hypothetical protein